MKKIIYSIVTALVLSVILVLFIPQLFLRDDARWTYQNDAARVDISFNGHLKKARVIAEGTDIRILQPEWLSDHRFQGTVILAPVSYKKKTYRIKLTPQVEELGEDATLVIELKGRDFQHQGKRKPAWICFQNITLNGQSIATDKVVWHDHPFILKYPLSTQGITLAFDACKPLALSDIAFVNILTIFFAFLLAGLFLTQLKSAAYKVLTSINQKDIVKVLSDAYRHIDPVYRRAFWIILGVICFAFGLHAIWFMWGNHDWVLMERKGHWLLRADIGRYMIYSIKMPFSEGIYIPIFYDLIAYVSLAFNAVLLCRYWRLEKRVIYYVLCGLILTAQPFTLSMTYFVNMIPEVFIGVTYALVALLLSEKVSLVGVSLTKKVVYSLTAIVLINFALAVYPVLINTIAVLFAGRLLMHSFDWDGSWKQLKSCIGPFVVSSAHIILGIVLYKLVISYVFPARSFYNTDTLPLEQVPERLGILFKQCCHQLCEYNYPFITQWILWVFLGFAILLVLHILITGNIKQKIARLLLLFGSLFATQTAMIIARTHMVDGRVELFGLVFFEVLVMVSVITKVRQIYNLWVIAGVSVVVTSVIDDLDCLRVWKLGFDAEKMLWNRILARLEIQKDFDPVKKYEIVLVGNTISLRPRYYVGLGGSKDRSFMLYQAYDFSHYPLSAPMFYYPTRFCGAYFSTRRSQFYHDRRGYEARLKRLYQAGVLQRAEVWPKPNGLIVWKNIILFVTDGKELEKCKKQFERELGKK